MNMPSAYIRKSFRNKKLSSKCGSITVKSGNCETENEFFLVKNQMIRFPLITTGQN